MYSNPMNTLADAYEVIRRYGLEYGFLVDGGSAQGFAAWLYVSGRPLPDVAALARELKKYKADYAECVGRGEDLDEDLRDDATDLTALIEQHMKDRLALAGCIRSVKFSEGGGHVWDCIANLATSADHVGKHFSEGGGHVWDCIANLATSADHVGKHFSGDVSFYADRVAQVVQALRQHKFGFEQAEGNRYRPGEDDELDALVLADLVELDQSLFNAPVWAGKEPLGSFELTALFDFVKNLKQAELEGEAVR